MLIPVLIGIVISGYGVMELICKGADDSYYDAKCKGTLLSVRDIDTLDPTGEYKQKALRFRYKVGQSAYEEVHIQSDADYTEYITGRIYELRYHTDHPKDFTVDYKQEPTSLYYASIIAGLVLIVLTFTGIIKI